MAQGNHFLNIPKQEGLFTTIKNGRTGETRDDSPVEDEDDEETEEVVRFIPRCSPVPRKRGPSIADETAEYMRIRLTLPQRRVSFADASGRELVDVREFAAFDSDDEEDNSNWEEEEAKCRRTYLEPVYLLWPEFQARVGSDLTLAVSANKVEVEKVTVAPEDPLSFDALICVLNVSFQKCVYVRSTMDGWITHSDSAAEYVQGSHDGDTDKFSCRLSFAEPYLFTGARIDFVVRYNTPDGEFWANNSGRNYSVSLVVSYEEETAPVNKVDDREMKGILKPPRYREQDDFDFYPDTDDGNEYNTERGAAAEVPSPVCPLVIEPEIDIEVPEALIALSKSREDHTLAVSLPLSADRKDEHPLQDLTENPLHSDHLEKGQGTELLISTENVISMQNEALDNASTLNCDVHSDKLNQPFCPNQENPQSGTAVQATFDLDITLPGIFPSIQDMGEELKDHKQNNVIQSGEWREAQLQDQTSEVVEVGNTESLKQESRESTQQCSLNDLITASVSKGKGDFIHSTGHDILLEESHEPLLENPEMQMMKHDTIIRRETSGKEQADLSVREVPDMNASCLWQPFEPTNLGQKREEHVIQNSPNSQRTPDPEVHEVFSVNVDTPYGPENTATKEESQVLTSLSSATATSQSLTTTEDSVSSEGGDGETSMTQEESLSNEKFELYSDDPASFQKQEGLESQPALPCKTLEASSAEVDVTLRTLIPSFAFLSATVCLIVGFYEPSIFLIMALFLVSLCF
ncbi:hypothetical protein Q7C36_012715 [Tachysurus vachellii]|uniref:CBM21 domain-containing protein n=1 Tax=Tachysurus vachellii TaxID=175792 RepID=A0AA88MQK6_TACVA|nr:hypothetical protein Q7C36_012715 [Tachysurus vachellii]